MKPDEYIKHVKKTESPNFQMVNERILHSVMGIGTEAGEIQDVVKKSLFYGRTINPIDLIEEGGDLLWYLGILFDEIGVTFEQVMAMNIAKLKQRYPQQFTEKAEQNRDYAAEMEAAKAVIIKEWKSRQEGKRLVRSIVEAEAGRSQI